MVFFCEREIEQEREQKTEGMGATKILKIGRRRVREWENERLKTLKRYIKEEIGGKKT